MRVLQGRIPQTPTITIQTQFVNHEEGTDNPEQIASEEVDQHVVPPALLEIIKHIPEGVLDDFEGGRSEEDEL
jgi:hypothetical protein